MSFWSDDINVRDLRSPEEILAEAGEELASRTDRQLTVHIVEAHGDNRVTLVFEVHGNRGQPTLNLFEASHQPGLPYPAAIHPPPVPEVPDYLQRERYVPGTGDLSSLAATRAAAMSLAGLSKGRTVTNEWIAATPTEFREKLGKLLGRNDIKSRLISLLSLGMAVELKDDDDAE